MRLTAVRLSLLHPMTGSSAAPPRTLLGDRDGRFRIVFSSKRFRYRMVSISDGRSATQEWGSKRHPVLTEFRGSERFLADQADCPRRIVQAYLAGTAPVWGAAHAAETAFRTARGHVSQVVRELRPGVHPAHAIAAYWLGPTWMDHRAARAARHRRRRAR